MNVAASAYAANRARAPVIWINDSSGTPTTLTGDGGSADSTPRLRIATPTAGDAIDDFRAPTPAGMSAGPLPQAIPEPRNLK